MILNALHKTALVVASAVLLAEMALMIYIECWFFKENLLGFDLLQLIKDSI